MALSEFKNNYIELYKTLVDTTKDTAFYKDMIKNITDAVDESSIREDEKLAYIIQAQVGIVNSTTQNAMQTALSVIEKEETIELDLELLQSSIDLKDASVGLANRQKTALDDARNVKKAETLGNTIALIESGGSNAPAETWTKYNSAIMLIG
ncbi:MAG: hypothetical protein GQ570_15035 [Helicobacteraceae bacterium]|nr:hypothetical protein [Helicobacteraceae bacterium]